MTNLSAEGFSADHLSGEVERDVTPMVRKVADAVASAWAAHGDVPFPLYDEEAIAIAQAAIEAMREPTEAMLSEGRRGKKADVPYDRDAALVWSDMIDAATATGEQR